MSNIQESFGIRILQILLDLLIFKTQNSQLSNSLYVLGPVNVVGHFNNWKYLKFKGTGSNLFGHDSCHMSQTTNCQMCL